MELYSKEGFVFSKIKKNNYTLSFHIENNRIYFPKIIDFHLIKLIYDLNGDIYENIQMNILDDNNANILLLMKPLFVEIGLPQRYSNLHITKQMVDRNIQFISQTITEKPQNVDIPPNTELMPIKTLQCDCVLLNDHIIQFTCNVLFEENMFVPPIAEKLIGMILYKIFRRIKKFIEDV